MGLAGPFPIYGGKKTNKQKTHAKESRGTQKASVA